MSGQLRFRPLDGVFGADLRSLAAFRIGIAAVLLWDLFDRAHSVAAHYTDVGTMPSSMLSLITFGAPFSIHYWLSGHLAAQWALLGLAAAAGVALLVGWWTRVAAAVSWYLLASLQVRSPLVSWEGADKLLCILVLWCVLAPVGARLSLDARRAARAGAARTQDWLCTPTTALFVLQIFSLYFVTGLAKTGLPWADGTALARALRIDFFGSPSGVWLRQFDPVLVGLTHATLVLERFLPFLLFVPVATWMVRLFLIASFVGFHLGILVFMGVGIFSPLSIAMWLALVPSQVWDALGARRGAAAGRAARPRLRTPLVLELAAAGLCAFLVLNAVARTVGFFRGRSVPLGPIHRVASVLRVQQSWGMFAPEPKRVDVWPVLRGRLASGRLVDPFRGGPVVAEQPADVGAYFPSFKWKLHFWRLAEITYDEGRPFPLWEPLAEHLCRVWNAHHEGSERLRSIDIDLQVETIEPTRPRDPIQTVPILRAHRCPA
jgi:hypothetical protein